MNAITQAELFIDDQSIRSKYIEKVEVLSKVKNLVLLPDNESMTIRQAAEYYEVSVETIRKTIQRNRSELMEDGVKTLYSKDLQAYKVTLGQTVPELDSQPRYLTLLHVCFSFSVLLAILQASSLS